MSVIIFVLVISLLLVLMEDQWKTLNEKGVAVVNVEQTLSSPLKLFVPSTSMYCISAQKDKEDYDNSDISLDVLIFDPMIFTFVFWKGDLLKCL